MTVVLLILSMCVSVSVATNAFEQVCYPNGTVQVTNPNPSTYISVFAVQDEGYSTALICDATISGDKVYVTGCDTGKQINIFMTDRPASDNATFVGSSWVSFCVICDALPTAGVDRTVNNQLGVTLEASTQDDITPSFTISSAIRRTSPDGSIASAATVGEQLYFTIDIPSDYNGRPTCTAYAGSSDSGSPSKLLFNAGCSQDSDLLGGDFENEYTSIPFITRLYVNFYAFRFYNNKNVYFQCSVKLCPSGSSSCDLSCGGSGKRSIYGRVRRTSDVMSEGGVDQVFTTHSVLQILEDTESCGNTVLVSLLLLSVTCLRALAM